MDPLGVGRRRESSRLDREGRRLGEGVATGEGSGQWRH